MNLIISNHTISQHNGLFSLNDLHEVSGGADKHRPTFFMRNQETQELIAAIESENTIAYHTVKGGNTKIIKQGTYVCKELVYRYAMWISAKFSLMVIRAFDALNTGAIPALAHHTISVEQQAQIRQAVARRCQSNRQHYQTIYSALHQKFNIPRYSELLASDFDNAMSFIRNYGFGNNSYNNGYEQLYIALTDSVTNIRAYLKLIKSLKELPFMDEDVAQKMYHDGQDAILRIAKIAQTLDLQNMQGKPMFEPGRLNYYGGAALIYR